eukprot:Pgem_evm1s13275
MDHNGVERRISIIRPTSSYAYKGLEVLFAIKKGVQDFDENIDFIDTVQEKVKVRCRFCYIINFS